MNKQEFLQKLSEKLADMPKDDIKKFLDYYGEIIDDRIEDGVSEEEAVKASGSIDEIAAQIRFENNFPKAENKEKHKFGAVEIVLIVLGFPIWLPLIITGFALVLTAYILLWTAVIVLYSVVFSFAAAALMALVEIIFNLYGGNFINALGFFGIMLFFAGITILSFIGTNFIVKQIVNLSKLIFKGSKKLFTTKRRNKK